MNNGYAFNQREVSPNPGMNGVTFISPSLHQPRDNSTFASSRIPCFKQSFPSPIYTSTPCAAHRVTQKKRDICFPKAEPRTIDKFGFPSSSQSSNSFISEKSFDCSFVSPRSQSSFCSERSLHESFATPGTEDSIRLDHLNGEGVSGRNLNFSSRTKWCSSRNGHTDAEFRRPNLPHHRTYNSVSTNTFRGTKRVRDETSNDYLAKTENNNKRGKSVGSYSNVKTPSNKFRGSDIRKVRRCFRSPALNECNPGHSSDIDDYVDNSMLEDPWKELLEKLVETEKLKIIKDV